MSVGYPSFHRRMLADPYYGQTVANLRRVRETAGLSQGAVADVIGVTWETVSSWERRVTLPSLYHFIKWCEYLNFEMKEKE